MIDEIFADRMLNAALYVQSTDQKMAFTARMVLNALTSVRDELKSKVILMEWHGRVR